ncbi:Hypothetical protein AA314_01769 [Archangium gephyra]|uniref:Uncharacterized protein n=1 Tax=Archangium gephyra TaxID=48 RepID=A0AAC8Q4D7_9BACT|nr:Hypothetical protein AA314_01769 [Archangium gephyra]
MACHGCKGSAHLRGTQCPLRTPQVSHEPRQGGRGLSGQLPDIWQIPDTACTNEPVTRIGSHRSRRKERADADLPAQTCWEPGVGPPGSLAFTSTVHRVMGT